MPAPIFGENRRIIAEQPDTIYLPGFLISQTFTSQFSWQADFTPPTGVTLSTSALYLNIAANVSEGYQETPLQLTATSSGDSTDVTLTLVTLTPKSKLVSIQNSATDFRQRIFLAGVDISDRVEPNISFTNDIDADFLNKFTISAVNLTFRNDDGIFSFLSPRNFFVKHGLPASGTGAPVRIAMGFHTAEHGEVLRSVFCGMITDTVFDRRHNFNCTVVNSVSATLSAKGINSIEVPITIEPDINSYDISGTHDYNAYSALPNTLRGGKTFLVNNITNASQPYAATQTGEGITYGKNRSPDPSFTAYYQIPIPGVNEDTLLRNYAVAHHIPNLKQQQQQQQQQLIAFSCYADAFFNLQTPSRSGATENPEIYGVEFGSPGNIVMGSDDETIYGIVSHLHPDTPSASRFRPRVFKYSMRIREYGLIREVGQDTHISNLMRRSDTEFYMLQGGALARYQGVYLPRGRRPHVNIRKLTIDAQGIPTLTTEKGSNFELAYETFHVTGHFIQQPNAAVLTGTTISSLVQVNFTGTNHDFFNVYQWDFARNSGTYAHRLPQSGSAIGIYNNQAILQAGLVALNPDDLSIWYYKSATVPQYPNALPGIRVKAVGTDLPYSLHINNTLNTVLNDASVRNGVSYARTVAGRTFFVAGGLYERLARTPTLGASVNAGGGGYHCRLIRALGSNDTLGSIWEQDNVCYCTIAIGADSSANPVYIYRIETNGELTALDPFPVLAAEEKFDGRWVSNHAPVIYQDKPVFYAAGPYKDISKSLVGYTDDTNTYTIFGTNIRSLFDYLNSHAIDRFSYWYFDIERLYFRQRTTAETFTVASFDAATSTLRYMGGRVAQPTASGTCLIGGELLTYTGTGTVTEGETTYQTLTGVTRGEDRANTRLLAGEFLVFISDVLSDVGLQAIVLTSHAQMRVTQRIERLQVRALNPTTREHEERVPVQVTPGERVTVIDTQLAPDDETALSALEASYTAYFKHDAVVFTLTCRPRYSLQLGEVVYLNLQRQGFQGLAQITSITYNKSEFGLKARSLATAPRQSYPWGGFTQRGIAYDFETDRLYINYTEGGVVRYHEVSVVTGELIGTESVEVASGGVGRGGNAGIHGGYLYMKNSQSQVQRLTRLNLETFAFDAPWQWLATGSFSGTIDDSLAVDADGGLWVRMGTTVLTKLVPNAAPSATAFMTQTTPPSLIIIPTELQSSSPRFTYWHSLFWGVDRSGDVPVLKGFRKKTDGTTEVTQTLTLPSNLFTGQRFSAFTRGRHGWYFLTRDNLYFIADSESGFDPAAV